MNLSDRWTGSPDTYRWRTLRVAALFLIVTGILGVFYPQTGDAPLHIIRGEFIIEHLRIPYFDYELNQVSAYVYPPLFHILIGVVGTVTGLYTLVPAAMGAISVWLTYELVRYWWVDRNAYLSALAVALNPFFILWSIRVYAGTTITAGFLLTFILYFRFLENGHFRNLLLAYAIGGGLIHVKTYGPATVVIMTTHYFVTRRSQLASAFQSVLVPGILSLLTASPYMTFSLLRTGSPLPKVTGIPGGFSSGRSSVEGLFLFIPTPVEAIQFLTMAVGVNPKNFVTGPLKNVVGLGIIVWIAFIGALGLVVLAGLYHRRNNRFILVWIAVFVAIYEVQRVVSGGITLFKFRHFITTVPIIGFLVATAYRRSSFSQKRLIAIVVIVMLLVQFSAVGALFTVHNNAQYDEITTWIDGNIETEEIIYSPNYAALSYRTSGDYKIIFDSRKIGYVNPRKDFSSEIRKADWVIVREIGNTSTKIERAVQGGVLRHEITIDGRRSTPWGEPGGTQKYVDIFGTRWHVYDVE